MTDTTPRYAPETVLVLDHGYTPVLGYTGHPPGTHDASPIRNEYTALEIRTCHGSQWWGFDRVWINSELRMVVQGFDSRDEVRASWPICETT